MDNKNTETFLLSKVFIARSYPQSVMNCGAEVVIQGIPGLCKVVAKKTVKGIYGGSWIYVIDEHGKEHALSKANDGHRIVTFHKIGTGPLSNRNEKKTHYIKKPVETHVVAEQQKVMENTFLQVLQEALEKTLKPVYKALSEQALSIAALSTAITNSSNSNMKSKQKEIKAYLETDSGRELIIEMLSGNKTKSNFSQE